LYFLLLSINFLYKEPIDTTEWNAVIDATHDFVKKHAHFNKTLNNYYKKLKKANGALIKEIAYAYDYFYNPNTKRNLSPATMKEVRKQVAASINKIADNLSTIERELQDRLKNKKASTHGQEKVLQVLYRLAITLATTAEKASIDLLKF